MNEIEFRQKMDKLREKLRGRIPDQSEAVDETFDKMISEAVELRNADNKEDAPHHYMHLVTTLVGKRGDKRFWSFLESVRKVLIVGFLQHDVPEDPPSDLNWNWVSH